MKENAGEIDEAVFAERRAAFCAALDNDMNTALAVTAVYDVLKAKTTPATKLALIADFDKVLGLDLCEAAAKIVDEEKKQAEAASADPFVAEIERLIVERAEAKKAKNYARADEIRNELSAKGVTLIDTPQGTKFTIA